MLNAIRAAAIGTALLSAGTMPARAQAPEFVAAVAMFVGSMSVAAPACGTRDRPWGVRLVGRFALAANGLPGDAQARAMDLLSQAQTEARAAVAANRSGYCATNMTAERLGHLDSLADGTMAFW